MTVLPFLQSYVRFTGILRQRLVFMCFLGLSISKFGLLIAQTPPQVSALLAQYDSLATACYNSSEIDKMYVNICKGVALEAQSRDGRYRGIFLAHKARYLKRKNQLDSVLIYAREAIPFLQRYKEWKQVSRMMYLESTVYLDKNEQVGTLKNLILLINFNEKHKEHTNTGNAYHLLSRTFHRLKDTLNEKKYILKHLELAEKQDSDFQRLYAFEAWAGFLTEQKQYRLANTYFTKAYELVKRQNNEDANAGILITMGANFIAQKEYTNGLATLRLAEKIALKHIHELNWNQTLATDYAYISSLFLATGKPKEALDYARRSFALVEKNPLLYDYHIQALKNQVSAQKALRHYRQALQSYEQLQKITHSIDLNKDREIAKDIEAKYQLEKSEREKKLSQQNLRIKNLELQNEQKQGRILAILLAVFALSLAAGAWFFSKTQVYNLRLNKKKQQLEELNETKDKLFGIIGHDLRASAVNLDSTLILLEQKNSDQQQLADHIATLRKKVTAHQTILNNLLYWALSQRQVLWANPRLISLKVNIDETLDSLRGLMQEKALHTQWTAISADTVYADENHLQIVLYNLIHNAIKFSPYGGGIQLSITKNSGTAVLSITNKGEEFEWGGTDKIWVLKQSTRGTSGEKGTGLGLLVCAELIKLNKGSIRAYSNVETTTLELIFPLMQASNDV